MTPKDITKYTTHCEIHPATMFSVVTQNIPLANHNPGPRNVFFGAQGKQAIGCYATSFNNRIDTMSYVLHYPQRPIVGTRLMSYIGNNDLPHGENLIVAIASYTGYNQEDAVILNERSLQNGSMNLTYFKNIIEKEDDNPMLNESIVFQNPIKLTQEGVDLKNIKFAKYGTLDDNGFPKLNTYISEGDAVVGKCVIKRELVDDQSSANAQDNQSSTNALFESKVMKETYTDVSNVADKTMSGIVDKVFVYNDEKSLKTCKVRFRKIRIPELGDKFASRYSQKGTVGLIVPPENMPFNEEGIVPDIIINPHAFPSRMTVAHLLECLLCKAATHRGCYVDATPFNAYDFTDFTKTLENYGLQKYGDETLYNGFNGKKIETQIFFGPTYYMRLKHMVADKMNYRSTGPNTLRTRQPTKGRGSLGGLRIGEMENFAIWGHTMMNFNKESMMERSDKYECVINPDTGLILDRKSGAKDTSTIKVPYSFKLAMQELMSMSVAPRINYGIDEQDEDDGEGGADAELEALMEDEDSDMD